MQDKSARQGWRYLLVIAVVILVGAMAALQFLDYYINQRRQQVAVQLGNLLRCPVSLRGLHLRWHGLMPQLKLNGLRIERPNQQVLTQIHHLTIRFNAWRDLWAWRQKHSLSHMAMTAKLYGVYLKYSPRWPSVSFSQGKLTLSHGVLTLKVAHASTQNTPLNNLTAQIVNLNHPLLTIAGYADTDMVHGQDYLNHTSLHIAKELAPVKLTGPMRFYLHLTIPLQTLPLRVKASGQVRLMGAAIKLPHILSVNKLHGLLQFTNRSLTIDRMNGKFLGQPLQFALQTVKRKNKLPYVLISVGGKLDMTAWLQSQHSQLAKYASGIAPYRALLMLQDGRLPGGDRLSFYSDLRGIKITGLPVAFTKSANTSKVFNYHWYSKPQQMTQIRLDYGGLFSMAKQYSLVKQPELLSAHYHFGSAPAKFLAQPGTVIDGHLTDLNWRHVAPLISTSSVASHDSLKFRYADLRIDQASVLGQHLKHLHLTLTSQKNTWRLGLDSQQAQGVLIIPAKAKQSWQGRFQKLVWQPAKKIKVRAKHSLLPSLNLTAQQFQYGKLKLGQLKLILSRVDKVQHIKINTDSKLNQLHINAKVSDHNTGLSGTLNSKNLGQLLSITKLNQSLVGGAGAVRFNLHWSGALHAFTLAKASGEFNFNVFNGMIVKLSHQVSRDLDFGKLLNTFTLNSLTRRLGSIFSHNKLQGLNFDHFSGNFLLTHGVASTQNAQLNAAVGEFDFKGQLNFAKHQYDFKVKVDPYVTNSLPLVIGIAGGPIAGVMAWVANKILRPEFGKLMSFHYNAKGTWGSPRIRLEPPVETGSA